MRPVAAANVALRGLTREIAAFERKASDVVEQTTAEKGFEPVGISHEARSAGENLDGATQATLEGALVDLRISKYLAIANMKVLSTLNDVERAAADIIR
jgi:hypothetical protein